MYMKCRKIVCAAMTLSLGLLYALGDAAERVEKVYTATTGTDGIEHVSVVGGSYFFDPNVIVLKANVPVELTIKLKEGETTSHNIAIKAPDAGIDFKTDIKEEPVVVKFTPTKAGEYQFECTKGFGSHKDKGMFGVIRVVK